LDDPSFRIPILPKVAEEAIGLSEKPNVSLAEVGKLIERDQVLAARFITAANSPLYNRGIPVLSVQVALTRMGLVSSRDLLVYAAMEPFFTSHKVFATELERLRLHTLATSAACTYLAQLTKLPLDGAAGLMGLIHDLGALALISHVAMHQTAFAALVADRKLLGAVLRQIHERAGSYLATHWKLPTTLRLALGGHHHAVATSPPLLKLLAAGDALAMRSGAAAGFEDIDAGSLTSFLGPAGSPTLAIKEFSTRVSEVRAHA
jgi:HD-like signal output (HDOD) protein